MSSALDYEHYVAGVKQRMRYYERRGVVFAIKNGQLVARTSTGLVGGNIAAWVAEHREVIAEVMGAR